MNATRFTIDGLPRTGSTSIANMFSCHSEITCLIEPFHPVRYRGQYNRQVYDEASLCRIMSLIWLRWQSIKHVWQVPGQWPFTIDGEVNECLLALSPAVVSVERENLLQRYVSSIISQKLQFWIGPRSDFVKRLQRVGLPEIDLSEASRAIERDRNAVTRRRKHLAAHPRAIRVTYESLFGQGVDSSAQLSQMNVMLKFLGYTELAEKDTRSFAWLQATDARISKWNTKEVYAQIKDVNKIDVRLGSSENGWLLRGS